MYLVTKKKYLVTVHSYKHILVIVFKVVIIFTLNPNETILQDSWKNTLV